jgi:hypothetical protein
MESLYIWYPTSGRRTKGVPVVVNDVWIRENFTYGKEIEGLVYKWNDYEWNEEKIPHRQYCAKLPKELFLIFQREKNVLFDFLPYYEDMFIISEEFKIYIEEQLNNKIVEYSKLNVFHKSNREFTTQKKYYLLRVLTFDDDLFDFVEDGKKYAVGLGGKEFIYPNLGLKKETDQQIFFLDNFCYQQAVIFTEKIKEEIKNNFYAPEIYKIYDFYLAFNNRTKKEHLPNMV